MDIFILEICFSISTHNVLIRLQIFPVHPRKLYIKYDVTLMSVILSRIFPYTFFPRKCSISKRESIKHLLMIFSTAMFCNHFGGTVRTLATYLVNSKILPINGVLKFVCILMTDLDIYIMVVLSYSRASFYSAEATGTTA